MGVGGSSSDKTKLPGRNPKPGEEEGNGESEVDEDEVERQELFTNISGLLIKKLDKYNRHDLVTALLFGENVHDSDRYQHNKLLFKNFQNFLIKTKRLCYKSKLQHTINL